jgi:hypothetical protein
MVFVGLERAPRMRPRVGCARVWVDVEEEEEEEEEDILMRERERRRWRSFIVICGRYGGE